MPEPQTIVVKKYENRRLYDTFHSRYVNLDEVASLLQQGHHVQVVDLLSGEDITRLVLTQIIVENAKAPNSTFPIEILRQMVIASGRVSQASTKIYVSAFAEFYERSLRALVPTFPFQAVPTMDAPASGKQTGKSQESVEDLKSRLAELENLVSTLLHKASPTI